MRKFTAIRSLWKYSAKTIYERTIKMTQQERILKYMDDFGSISPMEAFNDLGITKLATRISEMIQDGLSFEKKLVSAKNRYGETVHYMRYSKAV